MAERKTESGKYVVCEFFGLELTTKNPDMARILQTDVGEFLGQEIYLCGPEYQDEQERPTIERFFRMKLRLRPSKRRAFSRNQLQP